MDEVRVIAAGGVAVLTAAYAISRFGRSEIALWGGIALGFTAGIIVYTYITFVMMAFLLITTIVIPLLLASDLKIPIPPAIDRFVRSASPAPPGITPEQMQELLQRLAAFGERLKAIEDKRQEQSSRANEELQRQIDAIVNDPSLPEDAKTEQIEWLRRQMR
jgi:hypothetical protein